MAANFNVDVAGAVKKIEEKKKAVSDGVKKALKLALTDARDEIIERTQAGVDSSGKPFVGYSEQYKKFRIQKNRKLNPDLTFTGTMLRSIQIKVSKKGGELLGLLFFPKSQSEKVRGNQKIRRFFELSKKQFETIKTTIEGAINGRR